MAENVDLKTYRQMGFINAPELADGHNLVTPYGLMATPEVVKSARDLGIAVGVDKIEGDYIIGESEIKRITQLSNGIQRVTGDDPGDLFLHKLLLRYNVGAFLTGLNSTTGLTSNAELGNHRDWLDMREQTEIGTRSHPSVLVSDVYDFRRADATLVYQGVFRYKDPATEFFNIHGQPIQPITVVGAQNKSLREQKGYVTGYDEFGIPTGLSPMPTEAGGGDELISSDRQGFKAATRSWLVDRSTTDHGVLNLNYGLEDGGLWRGLFLKENLNKLMPGFDDDRAKREKSQDLEQMVVTFRDRRER